MTTKTLKQTERGWGGHFMACSRCLFRRNTLLEYGPLKIVVSTVGLMMASESEDEQKAIPIGINRYYETMCFYSNPKDTRYHDADVFRGEISFSSPWAIDRVDADDEANIMHDNVVAEMRDRLLSEDPLLTEYDEEEKQNVRTH